MSKGIIILFVKLNYVNSTIISTISCRRYEVLYNSIISHVCQNTTKRSSKQTWKKRNNLIFYKLWLSNCTVEGLLKQCGTSSSIYCNSLRIKNIHRLFASFMIAFIFWDIGCKWFVGFKIDYFTNYSWKLILMSVV